ncbi:MAG TPA: YdcF family protein [Reyranella sp.]|nr:YdcF family protein [Reyranella sp.]
MNVLVPLLTSLVLPPASIFIACLAGLLLLGFRQRWAGRLLILAAIVSELLLSLPRVSESLVGRLEGEAIAAAKDAKPCCYAAIVVLGGTIVPASHRVTPPFHLLEGAERVVYAADLFHKGVAPRIIVSGGRIKTYADSEAQAMKELLVQLGVPAEAITLEDQSRNTLENIAFVHRIVGDAPVALVTSGFHMPRALKIARKAGLRASAFPTDLRHRAAYRRGWQNWLPSIEAEEVSCIALREYLALAFDERGLPQVPPLQPHLAKALGLR